MKSRPKIGLGFSIPWNVFAQDEATRADLVATAPLPLRILSRLTRRRFLALVAAAFDGLDVPAPVPASRMPR